MSLSTLLLLTVKVLPLALKAAFPCLITKAKWCLSVPDYEGEVERAEIVHCEYYDRKGRKRPFGRSAVYRQGQSADAEGF